MLSKVDYTFKLRRGAEHMVIEVLSFAIARIRDIA